MSQRLEVWVEVQHQQGRWLGLRHLPGTTGCTGCAQRLWGRRRHAAVYPLELPPGPVCYQRGQRLRLSLAPKQLVVAAVLMYGMPLLMMGLGLGLAVILGGSEALQVALAALFLAIGWALVRLGVKTSWFLRRYAVIGIESPSSDRHVSVFTGNDQ